MARKGTTFEAVMEKKIADGKPLPSEIDWARLAAYLDGEGCIRIRRAAPKKPGHSVRYDLEITVTNTDARLIQWLKNTFEGSVFVKERGGDGLRTCWYWRSRARFAAYILDKCLPYFIVKRDQADIGLAFDKLNPRSRPYRRVPEEVVDKRKELHHQMVIAKGLIPTEPKEVWNVN